MAHPLSALFNPQHIAIIGASESAEGVGERLFASLQQQGQHPKITPINLHHASIGGIPTLTTVERIPDAVDLAIITTPPATYDSIFKACLKQHIQTVAIFPPYNDSSKPEQADLAKIIQKAHKQGLRIAVCGPSGLNAPDNGLYANLYHRFPQPGHTALLGESHSLHQLQAHPAIGISRALQLIEYPGSLTTADILDYLNEDPATRQIVVHYAPDNANQAFFSVLRQAAYTKQVVLYAPQNISEQELAVLNRISERSGWLLVRMPDELQALVLAHQADLKPLSQLSICSNTETGWLDEQASLLLPTLSLQYTQTTPNPGILNFRHHITDLLAQPKTQAVMAWIEPTVSWSEQEIYRQLTLLQTSHTKPLFIVSPIAGTRPLSFTQPQSVLHIYRMLAKVRDNKTTAQQVPAANWRPIPPENADILSKLATQADATLQAINLPFQTATTSKSGLLLQQHPIFGPVLTAFSSNKQQTLLPPFCGLDINIIAATLNTPATQTELHQLIGLLNHAIEQKLPITRWQLACDKQNNSFTTSLLETGSPMSAPIHAFPIQQVDTDFPLRDGTPCRIRTIRPEDADALQTFISSLSPESRKTRFMSSLKQLPPSLLVRFSRPDYARECSLVAELSDGTLIGLAQYTCERPADRCEFGILVSDQYQGQGLAYKMMQQLIEQALRHGYRSMSADILSSNTPMLKLAGKLGFQTVPSPADRGLHVAILPLKQPQNRVRMKLTQQILAPKS